MSEENVAIVREAWDAWLRGDMEGMLAVRRRNRLGPDALSGLA
jgi:ketosteroid isomerase-like protein